MALKIYATADDWSSTIKSIFSKSATKSYSYSKFLITGDNTITDDITIVDGELQSTLKSYGGSSTYSGDGEIEIYGEIGNKQLVDPNSDGYKTGDGSTFYCNITDYIDGQGKFEKIVYTLYKGYTFASMTYDVGVSNIQITYTAVPYKVTFVCGTGGAYITRALVDEDTNTIQITAYPKTGYKFLQWADGVTTATRTESITEDIDFVAEFEPISYTVNYYDISSGEEKLYDTVTYKYDTNYSAPSLPVYSGEVPIGYNYNQTGWVTSDDFDQYCIDNTTQKIYNQPTGYVQEEKTEILNLSSVDGDIINLYFGLFPIRYTIYYKKYQKESNDNIILWATVESYRRYDSSYSLSNLTSTFVLTDGYKLTNQMSEEHGSVDTSIINNWFISSKNMNPGNETINFIEANSSTEDITVYQLGVPIDYFVSVYLYDMDGVELGVKELSCEYDQTYSPLVLEELKGREASGWYSSEQDISEWYIIDGVVNGDGTVSVDLKSSFSNLTTMDQARLTYYIYYIPKLYTISYEWLDTWGAGKFPLPDTATRVYGRDVLDVPLIPDYEEYDIDNVNTVNWYYYENNDTTTTQLINDWDTVPLNFAEDRIFYASKFPKGGHITFGVNKENWGQVVVENPSIDEDIYPEGSVINVHVEPTELAYFSHWSDGNKLPVRDIIVKSHDDLYYVAYFRSNQIYVRNPKYNEKERK